MAPLFLACFAGAVIGTIIRVTCNNLRERWGRDAETDA